MIFDEVVGDGTNHLKTWERACEIRLELMDERGRLKPKIDRETFERPCKRFLISAILNCEPYLCTGTFCEH